MTRGIQQDQVDAAADALLLRGERPTIERIRAELGTGSPATVNRLLDAWWTGLGQRLAQSKATLALPNAPAPIAEAFSALWAEALAQARSQLAAEFEAAHMALQRERGEFTERLQTAQEAEARAEGAALEALEQRTAAIERGQALEAELAALRVQINQLTDQVSRLTAVNEQLQAETTAAATRERQLQAQAREERSSTEAGYRAAQDHWLRELDRARQAEKTLVGQLSAAKAEISQHRRDAQAVEKGLNAQVRGLTNQLIAATKAASAAAVRKPTAPRRAATSVKANAGRASK